MKNSFILSIFNPKALKKFRGGYSHISNLKSIAVIAMMLLSIGVGNVWGDIGPYCKSDVAVGTQTVKMSFVKTGTNDYKIVITSSVYQITAVNGWAHTSGDNTYHYGASGRYSISDDGYTATIPFSSTTAPKLYNNLYVVFQTVGEQNTGIFNENNISWSESCDLEGGEEDDGCEDPDVTTVWFLNTKGWSDSYTYAYMWKGGTENAKYPGEVMTPTSIFNKDSKKLYYVTFDKDTYSKVKFNCNSNNSDCYTSDLDIQPNKCYNFASGWVTKPSAVHVATDVNSYSTSADPMSFICNSLDYEARVTFSTTGTHYFKIVVTDGSAYWYGCTPGTTPTASFSNYAFSTGGGSEKNMPFTADVAGDYYFKFNYATQTVSVTYPPYMTSASLDSKTATTAVISVESTRGTKYKVTNSDGSVEYTVSNGGAPTDGKITVTGLSANTQYSFKVYALDDNDTESANYSSVISFYTLANMGLASFSSSTCNSITLNVSSTGGVKYTVKSTDGATTYLDEGTPSDGKITVSGLSVGTAYDFYVYAVNSADELSTNYASVSSVSTTSAPATPSSISINTRTYNSITLNVTSANSTKFEYSTNAGENWKTINTTGTIEITELSSESTALSPNTSYTFLIRGKNDCGDVSDGNAEFIAKTTPQMTSASLFSKTHNSVVLSVASSGGTTYKVTNIAGEEYTLSSATPTDGKITVTNLTAGTAYTFRVYAMSSDATPIVSSNYIDVTTSTYPNMNAGPTGYYDCQVQAIHTSGDEYSPKGMILADWEGCTAEGAAYEDGSGKKAYKVNTNTTFYAGLYFGSVRTGIPTTLCDASSCTKLHVEFWSAENQTFYFNVIAYYGSNNNDGTAQSVSTSAGTWRAMDFTLTDFGTAISDHKDVISAFKIDYKSGNTNKELIIANAYFYTDDMCESEKCHGSGSAGSGLTINGATVFDSGESYWTKAYMKNDRLHIDAKFIPASNAAAAAYVQFIKSDGEVLEFAMTNKTDSFSVDIIPSNVTAEYRYDGIARYSVKFAITGGIRLTDYQYYDFAHSGCSDYFDIYHADAPAGGRTSFEGGFILQPIRYFRHFPNTDWTTITLPFEVTKVTVKEGEDEYDLYPRFNDGSSDVEGYYWLKTLSGEVAISKFKDSWEELMVSTPGSTDSERAANVKPAKNTPYIIAFPNGDYYSTNWVIFYGAACQTISSTFDGTSSIILSGEDYDYNKVQFVGNNTMKESSELKNIYMLEEGEDYFSRRESATVPAFEAYVKGTSQIQKSYVALRYRGGSSVPETPTDIDVLPTTECRGAIYNLSGMQMATFADRNAMEEVLNSLRAGVYIVHIGKEVNKVIVH